MIIIKKFIQRGVKMRKKGFLCIFTGFIFLFYSDFLFSAQFETPEEKACLYLSQGEVDKAVEILTKKIEANPHNFDVLLYLGIADYLKGDMESAFKRLKKVEKEIDRMIGASRPFGDQAMFTELGMDRKAERLFTKERKGLLYFFRGLTLKEKKDFNKAEKEFKKALKEGYDNLALHYYFFRLHLSQNNLKAASKQLKKIKEFTGNNEFFAFLNGSLQFRENRIKEAVKTFEEIVDYRVEAQRNLARSYYNSKNYNEAVQVWEDILSQKPDDIQALINTGRAYFHLGHPPKAQQYFERAGLKISPERYSPLKIDLVFGEVGKEIKFDLMCEVK